MPLRLKRGALHVAVAASGAQVAQFGELEATQSIPEAQIPQAGLAAVMDVHRAFAQWTQAIIFISSDALGSLYVDSSIQSHRKSD